MKKPIKKILSLALALCMLAAGSVAALADDSSTAGSETSVPVYLTAESAIFKVTLPTSLTFNVAANGTVTTASGLSIANKCNGQVKITAVSAKGINGWSIVANGTDFTKIPVGSKQMTLSLNDYSFAAAATNTASTQASGESNSLVGTVIDGSGTLALTYGGDFAEQAAALSQENVAEVIFTVGWNEA